MGVVASTKALATDNAVCAETDCGKRDFYISTFLIHQKANPPPPPHPHPHPGPPTSAIFFGLEKNRRKLWMAARPKRKRNELSLRLCKKVQLNLDCFCSFCVLTDPLLQPR